jgi:NifU-like protein involved in Fe-S cluster formation
MKIPEKDLEKEILIFKIAGYSEKSIKYYMDQTNLGILNNPDIKHIEIGECGDLIILYINLCEGPIIQEIKFKYIGCPALASSASSMTTLAIGKTIAKANEITDKDILNDLESIPEDHLHCPVLAMNALKRALSTLQTKKLLSGDEHENYIHACGLTGKQVDELSPEHCDNCDMVRECEKDHLILKKC